MEQCLLCYILHKDMIYMYSFLTDLDTFQIRNLYTSTPQSGPDTFQEYTHYMSENQAGVGTNLEGIFHKTMILLGAGTFQQSMSNMCSYLEGIDIFLLRILYRTLPRSGLDTCLMHIRCTLTRQTTTLLDMLCIQN